MLPPAPLLHVAAIWFAVIAPFAAVMWAMYSAWTYGFMGWLYINMVAIQDHSRNNVLCGILGHGEGWHNNHHAFPRSARHGLLWWQFDASYCIIRMLELLGLAWNVQLPIPQIIQKRRLKK